MFSYRLWSVAPYTVALAAESSQHVTGDEDHFHQRFARSDVFEGNRCPDNGAEFLWRLWHSPCE